jgi:hypothetical protein
MSDEQPGPHQEDPAGEPEGEAPPAKKLSDRTKLILLVVVLALLAAGAVWFLRY